jgi:hypothetical protein
MDLKYGKPPEAICASGGLIIFYFFEISNLISLTVKYKNIIILIKINIPNIFLKIAEWKKSSCTLGIIGKAFCIELFIIIAHEVINIKLQKTGIVFLIYNLNKLGFLVIPNLFAISPY